MQTFKYLSTKSLGIVWDWCEVHPTDSLSKLYMKLCSMMGDYEEESIMLRQTYNLNKPFPGFDHKVRAKRNLYREGVRIQGCMCHRHQYVARDTIGRIIFNLIRKQRQQEKLCKPLVE